MKHVERYSNNTIVYRCIFLVMLEYINYAGSHERKKSVCENLNPSNLTFELLNFSSWLRSAVRSVFTVFPCIKLCDIHVFSNMLDSVG